MLPRAIQIGLHAVGYIGSSTLPGGGATLAGIPGAVLGTLACDKVQSRANPVNISWGELGVKSSVGFALGKQQYAAQGCAGALDG